MNNTVKRLLTFILGIPFLFTIAVLLPHYNHLVLNIFVIVITFLGSSEMAKIVFQDKKAIEYKILPFLSTIYPLLTYLSIVYIVPYSWVEIYPIIIILLLFFRQIFPDKDNGFSSVIDRCGKSIVVLVYPTLFLSFITRLTSYENAVQLILFCFLVTTLNDSMAWLFGVLFGKHRNLFKVSPNKSLEGFVAGIITSIIVTLVYNNFFYSFNLSPIFLVLMGLLLGIATISGDLVESAFKRSGKVKDSGKIMPGRGGIIDSIDSIIFVGAIIYLFTII